MIISEINDLVPEADSKEIESTAHFISNHLGYEAPRVKGRKLQQQNKSQSRRSTRSSSSFSDTGNDCVKQHEHSEQLKSRAATQDELSNTVLEEFDKSMDLESTLDSTVTDSFLDDTYDTVTADGDDSLTELKLIASKKDTACDSKTKQDSVNSPNNDSKSDSEFGCIDSCTAKQTDSCIRCNICMVWFHTACVGIVDIDEVGAWTCVVCRKLPENVTAMKSQINSLLENTNTILKLFKSFTQKVDDKFENLNDRLTAIANQNKCYKESSISSMSDIRQDLTSLQNDVETKSGAILSRSQCILDKVRTTSDLVSKLHDGKSINTKNTNSSDHCVRNANQVATVEATNCHKTHSSNETIITIDDDDNDKNRHTKANPQTRSQLSDHSDSAKKDDNTFLSPKQPIKKCTFIVGSCILQSIETRFLAENVRVKSFKNASISALKQKLSTMDLSCYDKVVLHVGGNDVEAKVSPTEFKRKYQSLLKSVANNKSELFISGLLPRKGLNMKPFNNILKDLSSEVNATFIDNHDSFVMASGELPFEYFQADRVNLKFPGTRLLVRKINTSCTILPNIEKSNQPKRLIPYRQNKPRHYVR